MALFVSSNLSKVQNVEAIDWKHGPRYPADFSDVMIVQLVQIYAGLWPECYLGLFPELPKATHATGEIQKMDFQIYILVFRLEELSKT